MQFDIQDCILTLNVIAKNYLDWMTGSAISYISQICILGSRAYGSSDVQKICYTVLYALFKSQ